MLKIDSKRELRELYLPGRRPSLVDVPDLGFLMVDGRGDPNTDSGYMEALQALFSVAYTVRFALKRRPSGGVDFTVMPLESLWWTEGQPTLQLDGKSGWSWTAMIMQPDFIDAELVEEARAQAALKHASPALSRLRYERFAEGTAAQVMHIGPYSEEGPTIEALHRFITDQGHTLTGKHHEIYLGDPRRTAPERLRTVIRQPCTAH